MTKLVLKLQWPASSLEDLYKSALLLSSQRLGFLSEEREEVNMLNLQVMSTLTCLLGLLFLGGNNWSSEL